MEQIIETAKFSKYTQLLIANEMGNKYYTNIYPTSNSRQMKIQMIIKWTAVDNRMKDRDLGHLQIPEKIVIV